MVPPRSAFGASPQGGDTSGPAEPDPRCPLDDGTCIMALDVRRRPNAARYTAGSTTTTSTPGRSPGPVELMRPGGTPRETK